MGEVIQLAVYRTEEGDAVQDRLWDWLVQAVQYAWSWRDHESLNTVLDIVHQLRSQIEIPNKV